LSTPRQHKGNKREREVGGEFTYTRVYVKRDGRWQAVLSQYARPCFRSADTNAVHDQSLRASVFFEVVAAPM